MAAAVVALADFAHREGRLVFCCGRRRCDDRVENYLLGLPVLITYLVCCCCCLFLLCEYSRDVVSGEQEWREGEAIFIHLIAKGVSVRDYCGCSVMFVAGVVAATAFQ